jgi:hypothetical protein
MDFLEDKNVFNLETYRPNEAFLTNLYAFCVVLKVGTFRRVDQKYPESSEIGVLEKGGQDQLDPSCEK